MQSRLSDLNISNYQSPIFLLDENQYIDCNKAMLDLFEVDSKETFLTFQPGDMSPPTQPNGEDSWELAREMISSAFRDGHIQFEWVHRKENGEEFQSEVFLSTVQLDEWKVLQGYVHDITQRKQAKIKEQENTLKLQEANLALEKSRQDAFNLMEDANVQRLRTERALEELRQSQEALSRSEKRFRDLFENSPVAYQSLDIKGRFIHVNEEFQKMLGYKWEDLEGKEFGDIWINDKKKFFPSRFCTFRSEGETREELDLIKKNGEIITAIVNGRIQRDEKGKFVRTHCIFHNITQRKKEAEELAKAKEAAEIANRAKSDFLANMSHEIRTPLNAVMGLTHLALNSNDKNRKDEFFRKIDRSAKSLLEIVNNILDFSKIEANKVELENIPFHLDSVTHSLLDMFSQKIEEKGLNFLLDFPDEVPRTVVGDSLRFRQILTNLVSNAIKFTKKGEISIKARFLWKRGSQISLEFSVTDTGIGMSEDQVKRVFVAFNQGDYSTTRQYGGTGLGLSICQQLVALLGGELSLESKLGKGSTFSFTTIFDEFTEKEVPEHPPVLGVNNLRGLKILVIDGQDRARRVARQQLEILSFRPFEAGSVQEALDLMDGTPAEDPFRLILLDKDIMGTDGLETARLIRDRRSYHTLPRIILMSVAWNRELHHDIESDVIDGFLSKPFSISSLQDAIFSNFPEEALAPLDIVRDGKIASIPSLENFRILLAEDNELNQEVALGLLEETNSTVTVVGNGKLAVQSFMAGHYDLILMDIQMPEMDGYEATKLIRTGEKTGSDTDGTGIPRSHHIPIIAMTAGVQPEDRRRAFNAGIDDHITKPVNPDEFYILLGKWAAIIKDSTNKEDSEKSVHKHQDTLDEFSSFPGIDMNLALKSVRGKKNRLMKLLKIFADKQKDVGEEIRIALSTEDFAQAKLLVHTLKGIAGTLGARRLQESAIQLEKAVVQQSNKALIDQYLTSTNEALQEVFEGLAEINVKVTGTHENQAN